MKENINIIIPGLIALLFLIWKFSKSPIGGKENNFAYIQKSDPSAQLNYKKSHQSNEKRLTLKERLELSWQFLYDITDTVLGKFSQADQDTALNIGKTLLDNGGHYEHVIDYGIKHNLGRAQSKSINKSV